MKLKTFFLLAITLIVAGNLFAQQRGFKPVTVNGTGTTTLYKQSHALIIGMSDYTNGWPKLNGVKKDIPEVKTALEGNGFHVVVKMDLTKDELDDVFIDFIITYGQDPENRLIFYFAGHGHTLNKFGETIGYIVPVDAPNPNYNEAGFIQKAMPMSRIEEYAKQAGSKHALFLFDACFSGSLFATSRAVPEIINYKTAKPVRQFITSGSADETVPDKSIFREQFVAALTTDYADANKDGYLTGTELGKFLQDNVVNYSRNAQHPQYGKIRNQYLDKGDFVFILNSDIEQDIKEQDIEVDINEQDIAPLVAYGELKINNYLQGDLYIDGNYKQIANKNKLITITDIKTGTHTVKIKTDNETWQQQITINENKTVTLTAKSSYVPPQKNNNQDLPNVITDSRDGKTYKIVEIGDQIWMAENLAYKANSGCWAYDDNSSNVVKYGYLYNFETAKNVCPSGYHLPSYDEWTELEGFVGDDAGKKLKAKSGWNSNGNGDDEFGFNALSGGYRNANGSFNYAGNNGYWWSSTTKSSSHAWYRSLIYYDAGFGRYGFDRGSGFSVRCVGN